MNIEPIHGVPESVWSDVVSLKLELTRLIEMFLFENNDGITRQHAEKLIKTWVSYRHYTGLVKDYAVTCDVFNNKPELIDKNMLRVDIAAQFYYWDEEKEYKQHTGFVYIPITIVPE